MNVKGWKKKFFILGPPRSIELNRYCILQLFCFRGSSDKELGFHTTEVTVSGLGNKELQKRGGGGGLFSGGEGTQGNWSKRPRQKAPSQHIENSSFKARKQLPSRKKLAAYFSFFKRAVPKVLELK